MKFEKILMILLIVKDMNCTYIQTVLDDNIFFSNTSPQRQQDFSFNTVQVPIVEYSVWGWFKFNGDKEGIANFLIIKDLIGNSGNTNNQNNTGGIDPNFPACPFTQQEISNNPLLQTQQGVFDNPNCQITQVSPTNNIQSGTDLLIVNYDLNPGLQTYSIVFLFQNGINSQGQSIMKIDGFSDLNYTKNSWTFFSISCNYRQGTAFIYLKEFKQSNSIIQRKEINLSFPGFKLEKTNRMIFANKDVVPFFQTETFFIGNLAYFSISPFFTSKIEDLWMSYLNPQSYSYNGVILELFYEMNGKSQNSQGFIKDQFTVEGDFTSLSTIDNSKVGIQLTNSSFIDLGNISLQNSQQIQGIVFYFELLYTEPLPLNYVLVKRGQENVNGFLKIYLIKENRGRAVQLEAFGQSNSVNWRSNSFLPENQKIEIIIGLSISPSNSVNVVYYDSNKAVATDNLSNDFQFNLLSQEINLFKQNQQQQNQEFGSFEVYRTSIQNSSASVNYKQIFQDIADQDLVVQNGKCEIRTDFYKESFGCLKCNNSFLILENRKCESFCPFGSRNGMTGICLKCKESNCSDIKSTEWKVTELSKNIFRLQPTRKIQNFNNINPDQLFNVQLDGQDKSLGNFDYTTTFDEQNQTIDFIFDFNKKINDNKLEFKVNQDPNSPNYDNNGNIIYKNNVSVQLGEICILSNGKKLTIKIFAIIILILLLIIFLVLIFFTFSRNQFQNLANYWKFFLHIWMNFQVFLFFYFIGVSNPCCLRYFYNILFKITVKWSFGLRFLQNDGFEKGDFSGDKIDYNRPQTTEFLEENIKTWILANMGLLFVFHLIFFVIYLIVKTLSVVKIKLISQTFLGFFEYTALIAFFLMFHMQVFVFASLNIKNFKGSNSYFIFCLLISIAYIIVFLLFWIYSVYRMFSSRFYFQDPLHQNQYFYYFLGYKNKKITNTYDLWKVFCHFIIGILIGTAYGSPITQTILILILLIGLIIFLIIFRPFLILWQLITEIIFNFCMVLAILFYFFMAIKDKQGCSTCGDRESFICWFIILLLFFCILLSFISIMYQLSKSYFDPTSMIIKEDISYKQVKKQYLKDKKEILNEVITTSNLKESLPREMDKMNILDSKTATNFSNSNKNQIQNTNDFTDEMKYQRNQQYQPVMNKLNPESDMSFVSKSRNTLIPDEADEGYLQNYVMSTLRNPKQLATEDVDSFHYFKEKQKVKQSQNIFFTKDETPPYLFQNPQQNTKQTDEDRLNNMFSNN